MNFTVGTKKADGTYENKRFNTTGGPNLHTPALRLEALIKYLRTTLYTKVVIKKWDGEHDAVSQTFTTDEEYLGFILTPLN